MKYDVTELLNQRQIEFDKKTKEILDVFSLNVTTIIKSLLKLNDSIKIINILPVEANPKYVILFCGVENGVNITPLNIIVPVKILSENYDYDKMKQVIKNIISYLSSKDEKAFERLSDIYLNDLDGEFFFYNENTDLITLKKDDSPQITIKV